MKNTNKLATLALIIGALIALGCDGGQVSKSGTTGTTRMTFNHMDDVDYIGPAGADVAGRIFEVAKNHKDLDRIVVEITMKGEDSYGNKEEASISIVEGDLSEVRKYNDKSSYVYGGGAGQIYAGMILAERTNAKWRRL